MEFFKKLKRHTIDHLIRAKTEEQRDDIKGRIEAEKDLYTICSQFKTGSNELHNKIINDFVRDAEAVLAQRLLTENDPRMEARIISQVKHTRRLFKQYLKYHHGTNK